MTEDTVRHVIGGRNTEPSATGLILIVRAKGTKPKMPFGKLIEIPPTSTVTGEIVGVFVTPVVGEGGKDFTGKVILIDQLKRKHPTDKITFTWVGSTDPPKPPTPPSNPK